MVRGTIIRIVALLWFSGAALRVSILAVPPVIAFLRSDLQMSATEIGILSGLPMIMIAAAAVPGSFAISKFGALRTLVGALILAAIGAALRGFIPDVAALLASTTIMSLGIAIAQPALPVLVREWLPSRIGFGTAAYSNGMVIGCLLPVLFCTGGADAGAGQLAARSCGIVILHFDRGVLACDFGGAPSRTYRNQ